MTEFYKLNPAVNIDETGPAYPAVESFQNYNFNTFNSMHKLKFYEFPDFVPDIRFQLAKGAKLCDLMSQSTISAHGLLISPRLREILEMHKLVPHRCYHAIIQNNGAMHNYFWIHFVFENCLSHIDFSLSKFKIKKISEDFGIVKFENLGQFLEYKNNLKIPTTIEIEELILTTMSFNLFIINYFTSIIIDELLHTNLNKFKITGVDISKFSKISIYS